MDYKLKKKKIIALSVFIAVLAILTFCSKLFFLIQIQWVHLVINCIFNLLLGCVALFFIKKTGMKPNYGFRKKNAYFIGIGIAVVLQVLIGIIPALFGQSLVGGHTDFVLWNFIYQFFYFMLIIGPIEELIFRVYIQDTVIDLLPKHKWIGVIISSVLFGFWHLINGNIIQVLFTTFIGLVFGFSKYFIKECKYSGVAVAHGLYDFLNVVTTILFVK